MSKYNSLNFDAKMMNYYTSKLESLYKIAKDEIAHLVAMFKDALQGNSLIINTSQITPGMFHINLNIIRDPVVVWTKRSPQVRGQLDENEVEAPLGIGKRPRLCSICKGVGHDTHNCLDRERLRQGQGGTSSSHNTINHIQDSTQESFQSSDSVY